MRTPLVFIHPNRSGTLVWVRALSEDLGTEQIFKLGAVGDSHVTWDDFVTYAKTADTGTRYKVYTGHFWFGIHRLLPFETNYAVIFRDPYPRVWSHFKAAVLPTGLAFDAYLKTVPEATNGLVRRISGFGYRMIGKGKEDSIPWDFWNNQPAPADIETRLAQNDPALLDLAKQRLVETNCQILLTGRFPESSWLFSKTFGTNITWTPTHQHYNRTNGPGLDAIPAKLKEEMVSRNRLDRELFEFVNGEFEVKFSEERAKHATADTEISALRQLIEAIYDPERTELDIDGALHSIQTLVQSLTAKQDFETAAAVMEIVMEKPWDSGLTAVFNRILKDLRAASVIT